MDAPIIGFIGKRGSGKTLLMSILVYEQWKKQKQIWSNYNILAGKERVHNMTKEELQSFFDTKGDSFKTTFGGILAIDELTLFLDAYDFRTKKAKTFSYFVLQTRKRKVEFFYTVQQLRLIPVRIRDNTDYLIYPYYDKKKDSITYDIFSFDGLYKEYLHTKIIRHVSKYFGLYNTEEIIGILDDSD